MSVPSFRLDRAPWIPVLPPSGTQEETGIREALARAHELRLVARGHEHAAVLRVLLAAYDAAAGPRNWNEWAAAWQAPALDADRIGGYLDRYGDRLDLYHPDRPAFQAGGLRVYRRKHNVLEPAYLSGAAGEWFNRGPLSSPDPIPAADAARMLLVRIGYDVGGIKGGIQDVTASKTYGARPGHLGSVTHMSVDGQTLKDEILLNLPPRPRAAGDRPAWEQDDLPLTPGAEQPVTGRLAWWTWPGRIMRLQADENGGVTGVAWHDGLRPAGGIMTAARDHDPMTAWNPAGKRLSVQEGYGRMPAWFGARAAGGGCTAITHAAAAAARAILDPAYPLRVQAAWADYNSHATTMENEGFGTAPLGPASLLADEETRRAVAGAAYFANAAPGAVRRIASGQDGRGIPGLILSGRIALDETGIPAAWDRFLRDLPAGDGTEAVRAWRKTIADAAVEQFSQHARTSGPRGQAEKIQAEAGLRRYMHAIPLGDVPHPGPYSPPPKPRARKAEPAGRPAGRPPARLYAAFGEEKSLAQWAGDQRCTVTEPTLRSRVSKGEDPETAMIRPGRAGRPAGSRSAAGEDAPQDGASSEPPVSTPDRNSAGGPVLHRADRTPESNWRAGCRCGICRDAHTASTRGHRKAKRERDRADGTRPAIPEDQILSGIAGGLSLKDAAERAGLTDQQVHLYARENPAFGAALNAAGEALCADSADHRCGTPAGYRHLGCRATDCRQAHAEESRKWRRKT